MRKIEKEMIEAISNGKDYKKDNTLVCSHDDGAVFRVYLHQKLIAEKQNNELWLSDCNYQTKTTKSRLNAILSHFNLPTIRQKNKQWYVENEEWIGHGFFDISNDENYMHFEV